MGLSSELRYATRALARELVFASLCVMMLAPGIGANTAIFSVVNGVLLQALPYRHPDRLVDLREVILAIEATYPTLPVSARHFEPEFHVGESFPQSAIFPCAMGR